MLTRFTPATCPACGVSDKPTAQQPGNETAHGLLNLVPFAGAAYSGYRLSGARLFCPHCGHQYTDSLQDKAKAALDRARSLATLTAWSDSIDPATIPDQVLLAELRRRGLPTP